MVSEQLQRQAAELSAEPDDNPVHLLLLALHIIEQPELHFCADQVVFRVRRLEIDVPLKKIGQKADSVLVGHHHGAERQPGDLPLCQGAVQALEKSLCICLKEVKVERDL